MSEKIDTLKLVTQMRKDLQGHLEYATLLAELRWHSYQEHIARGFTPEQALALCSKPMGV